MDVLIKGMEMPQSCMDCPFKGFDRAGGRGNICTINDSITLHAVLDGVDVKFVRMGDCPLIPVLPHGRLIDADAMLMRINHEVMEAYMDGVCYGVHPNQEYLYLLGEIIDDAPTIIPASDQ